MKLAIKLRVLMSCRQRGAIGIFDERWFTVDRPPAETRAAVFEQWQREHGEQWEPHHLIEFRSVLVDGETR